MNVFLNYVKSCFLYFQTAYHKKDPVYKILRQTFALPLIPYEDIPQTFDRLKDKVSDGKTGHLFHISEENMVGTVENYGVCMGPQSEQTTTLRAGMPA